MCVSLLVVYRRLYPAAVNRQLDVKEQQLQFTNGKCELESWMKIADVIDGLLQLQASALRNPNYVINVALV